MKFSPNVTSLQPSATLAFAARARALRAEGRSVMDLSAGEPYFGTPAFAARAGIDAVKAGKTGYPPTPGIPELRDAIARYLSTTTAHGEVESEAVLVSAGVKQALFNCVYCLFGDGDQVLVPTPCWTSYLPQIDLAGAEPVVVPTAWEDGSLATVEGLEAARTERTRGLVLNSPGNPSGGVYTLDELAEIVAWADRHGLWVLSDEIYRRLHFGEGPAPSVLDLQDRPDRVVALDGVSKCFSMTGWRIGFAVGPRALISRASDLQSQTTSGAARPSQHAAAAAYGREEEREGVIADFRSRLRDARDASLELLSGTPDVELRAPGGGMFLYLRLAKRLDSDETAERLLVDAGVATVPGDAFGDPGHLRLSFGVETEVLEEGLRRLRDFFAEGAAGAHSSG